MSDNLPTQLLFTSHPPQHSSETLPPYRRHGLTLPKMTSPSPFISPLSRPTSARLRSSLVIPTFPQVLSELVQNSLDAGAERIDCWLDVTPGNQSLRVEDDGCGISREGLRAIGERNGEYFDFPSERAAERQSHPRRGTTKPWHHMGPMDFVEKVSWSLQNSA